MAIEYNWIISNLSVKRREKDLTDVIVIVDWRRVAKDGIYQTDVYGQVTLDQPDATKFISLSSVTEEMVIGWIEPKIEFDSMDANLANRIDDMKTPPVIVIRPPWIQSQF